MKKLILFCSFIFLSLLSHGQLSGYNLKVANSFIWKGDTIHKDSLYYVENRIDSIRMRKITGGWTKWIKTGTFDLSLYLQKADTANLVATKYDIGLKVDKVAGKGLSTNDYTTAEQSKLSGIATGAEVNVNADWDAVSGDAQILNKPTLNYEPANENIQAHISNTTTNPHNVTKSQVGLGNADNTSDANKPISTATQTALDLKQDQLVYFKVDVVEDDVRSISIPFIIKSTVVVFYNGVPLKDSQWEGIGNTTLILNIDTKKNDNILLIN